MAKATDKKTEATPKSLPEQLSEKRLALLEAKKGLGSTLQNPHAIKSLKKDIARILTKINAEKNNHKAQESEKGVK